MTFEEVLPKLKEGYECRRQKETPIHLKGDAFYRRLTYQHCSEQVQWYAHHEDLLADDWEVGRMVPTSSHAYLAYLQQDVTNWG